MPVLAPRGARECGSARRPDHRERFAGAPAEQTRRMDATVTDNPAQQRWEARLGGELAGYLTYRQEAGGVALRHTVVEPEREGTGIGGRLVRAALDDARSRHLAVLPHCTYVRGWIARHEDYADLVPDDRRAEFDLE